AAHYRVQAWRIGGYRGGDGRLVWQSGPRTGHLRAPPALLPATNTVVARWPVGLRVDTTGWPAGFYLLELRASDGRQALIPYTVRSRSMRGRVVLVAPEMDWAAYDDWGGYSLYVAPPGQRRSWAVSFDRPLSPGAGQFVFNVVPVVRLAERLGLRLGYATDVDVATHPGLLAGARAFVSLGHDEYWTADERRAVTRARDRGTNLAFLSANDVYWRVRLESTATGPARLLVGYKYSAATQDPLRFSHPAEITTRWRDGPIPDPENSLTGMRYECYPVDTDWRVTTPRWWGYRGTGVRLGSSFPHLVQMEADRVYPVAGTPHPLQVVASSPYTCQGVPTSAQAVYYTTRSGAGVVDVGTQWWPCALRRHCRGLPARDDAFARRVTTNLLRVFARGPAGRTRPAHENVALFGLSAVDSIPQQ
ncbi:MAG TPA: N,N-dimethylformamidase beta subunit family domain-containing protein, partial [Marmoricola sp.]|nr:N,N-dimethylformamidase beta subunit family domain-containing protein [Marmoricola sp.]